ncbi:MAG TPA: hypothetical protein VLT62_02765 [Candidatus Methylomirabilis sp.]|nr:hypothetical protein [Candidatus Methylomirabilis sp.]
MHYQFADRVREIDADGAGEIALAKTFPRTEDFFDGTFRPANEVPSSLVLETMASAGALLLAVRSRYRANGLLLKVTRATFPEPVRAGEELIVRLRLTVTQGDWTGTAGPAHVGMAQTLARGFVGETTVAEADLLFVCVPMAWVLGSQGDEALIHYLDLMGIADARPWERGRLPSAASTPRDE